MTTFEHTVPNPEQYARDLLARVDETLGHEAELGFGREAFPDRPSPPEEVIRPVVMGFERLENELPPVQEELERMGATARIERPTTDDDWEDIRNRLEQQQLKEIKARREAQRAAGNPNGVIGYGGPDPAPGVVAADWARYKVEQIRENDGGILRLTGITSGDLFQLMAWAQGRGSHPRP